MRMRGRVSDNESQERKRNLRLMVFSAVGKALSDVQPRLAYLISPAAGHTDNAHPRFSDQSGRLAPGRKAPPRACLGRAAPSLVWPSPRTSWVGAPAPAARRLRPRRVVPGADRAIPN